MWGCHTTWGAVGIRVQGGKWVLEEMGCLAGGVGGMWGALGIGILWDEGGAGGMGGVLGTGGAGGERECQGCIREMRDWRGMGIPEVYPKETVSAGENGVVGYIMGQGGKWGCRGDMGCIGGVGLNWSVIGMHKGMGALPWGALCHGVQCALRGDGCGVQESGGAGGMGQEGDGWGSGVCGRSVGQAAERIWGALVVYRRSGGI